MGEIFRTKSNVVFKRNRFGHFASECEMAANSTVRDLIESGARTSRGMAPSGPKGSYVRKPGYIPLKRSIKTQMIATTRGYWYSIAPHAMHVEFGTSAHIMAGQMTFWWAREGRWFIWNHPAYPWNQNPTIIKHPATRAQPFLRPAYERIKTQAMRVARENYPG